MPRQSRNADRVLPASTTVPGGGAGTVNDELFLEPMMGTPLAVYIDKEVPDRDQLIEIVTKHGGQISPGYSGVPYILVDPETEAGRNLYRQYVGKKGKIVLSFRWIHECIRANELQTYHTNWAGCRVTGDEPVRPRNAPSASGAPSGQPATAVQRVAHAQPHVQPQQLPQPPQPQVQLQQQHTPPQHQLQHQAQVAQSQTQAHASSHAAPYVHQSLQAAQSQLMPPTTPLGVPTFPYSVYTSQSTQHHASRPPLAPSGGPPQTWQTATSITPHQPHPAHMEMMPARTQHTYARDDQWAESSPAFAQLTETHLPPMNDAQTAAYYDQRYREGQQTWPATSHDYYDQTQSYETPYQEDQYVLGGPSSTTLEQQAAAPPPTSAPTAIQETIPAPSTAQPPSEVPSSPREENRGRRRTRIQQQPAPPASSLVLNRRNPPARSPTPPTRVIKSTYGGNLFTADDIEYLKKYIDYCQEQGLVLSLREICERIAVKAPHHTFYSWRRYCNKHQIRLGGYAMDVDSRSPTPGGQEEEEDHVAENRDSVDAPAMAGEGLFTIDAAVRVYQERGLRNRSPTPPRALYRSTTGKGIAFTTEDITFLCKFMAHRRLQNRLDMVSFWKDVAAKAPHHSRASWMKYYRRHKHELHRVEGDDPRPGPPPKKVRYGKNDDIVLAQYFATRPIGTSDKIFQEFAKHYPHHPWKGWQEHHRIHKTKIEHLIQRINNGEVLEMDESDD